MRKLNNLKLISIEYAIEIFLGPKNILKIKNISYLYFYNIVHEAYTSIEKEDIQTSEDQLKFIEPQRGSLNFVQRKDCKFCIGS